MGTKIVKTKEGKRKNKIMEKQTARTQEVSEIRKKKQVKEDNKRAISL